MIRRLRIPLLGASTALIVLMIGGALAVKVGASEGAYRQVLTFSEVLSLVIDNYVDPVDGDRLISGAYEGLLGGLDERGAFLSPSEVADWKTPLPDPLGETGLQVLKGGPVAQVVAVAAGSPADRAGILPGDQIRRVGGVAVRTMSHDQILRRLRGKPGTTIDLALIRPRDSFRKEDKSVTLAIASGPSYAITTDRGVAVLAIRDPGRVAVDDLARDLTQARTSESARLVVDLRNAASGSPRDAAHVLGLFVTGDLAALKDKQGKVVEKIEAVAAAAATTWPGRVDVLVNGATAGSTEAIAAALRARRGATVYGEESYGLGTEPRLIELQDGSGLLLSAFVWEAPDGLRWESSGIKPDREVRAEHRADESPEQSEAEQLRRVLELVREAAAAESRPKAA